MKTNRREALRVITRVGTLTAVGGAVGTNIVSALQGQRLSTEETALASQDQKTQRKPSASSSRGPIGSPDVKGFAPLNWSTVDELSLSKEFEAEVLVKLGDVINNQGETFGDCADFTCFFDGQKDDQAFLWVNHEYINLNVHYGKPVTAKEKSKGEIEVERKLVGGSYVELKLDKGTGKYRLKSDSNLAFRIDATTPIELVGYAGGRTATGTMGNCSGGHTPWGTILSAEENVNIYYDPETKDDYYGWADHFTMNPLDYGYIVEITPKSKTARKLTSLGRFAHEGCLTHVSADKRLVAYMGDDARFECLYKFVSKGKVTGDAALDADLLLEGTLFVADLGKGKWTPLEPSNEALAADKEGRFKTQSDICINTREAAKLAGGTPLNRPEGIALDPETGAIILALTNNSKAGDFHGSLLILEESQGLHSGTSFTAETYLVGGQKLGISCPDNICFGPANSNSTSGSSSGSSYLWVGTDISHTTMGKGAHSSFPRNAFHRIETDRVGNLYARMFMLGPRDAEVTGPCFSPNGKTLFLSIQHPGEGSFGEPGKGLTSNWPLGGSQKPLSSVVTIRAKKGSSFSMG